MERLTTDSNEPFGYIKFLNMFFVKNKWVHIRGAYGDSDSISLVDWVQNAAKSTGVDLPEDFEDFEDALCDGIFYGWGDIEGILAMLYYAACVAAIMRERLKKIEDILGDEYDLDRLCELVQADREGRIHIIPIPRRNTCGKCGNFVRVSGHTYGECKLRPHYKPYQSRVCCSKYFENTLEEMEDAQK